MTDGPIDLPAVLDAIAQWRDAIQHADDAATELRKIVEAFQANVRLDTPDGDVVTMLRPRHPRPFVRLSRSQLEQIRTALEGQRDMAIGETRAQRDRLAVWLEQRADAYEADATHLDRLADGTSKRVAGAPTDSLTGRERRIIAGELRDLARDCEEQR